MKILEKVFTNNYFFIAFLAIIQLCVFLGVSEVIGSIKDNYKSKEVIEQKLEQESKEIMRVQEELDKRAILIARTKRVLAELDARIDQKNRMLVDLEKKLDNRLSYRWHSFDMRNFCAEAELENATMGWKCPDLDDILMETDRK